MQKLSRIFVGLALLAILPSSIVRPADSYPSPEIESSIWLNSDPLTIAALRGKVVLIEFWTFGCSNCRNVEPYVKSWHARYASEGLVVIGLHAPEFDHERDLARVKAYVAERDLRHPIAIDNAFTNWKRFANRAWPAFYLIDKRGQVRYMKVGEGEYGRTEAMIQRFLRE